MTLQVGDKVVTIPLRDGGRVTVRSGTLSVGDKAVLIPGANGQTYAVRPASPQIGDKVILYPLRDGGHVCLASADDDGGGSSPSVMPPGNFYAWRTGPSTADLKWLPGEGNTAVRIVRRPDRYPVHINDGTVAYEGAGRTATDTGLDYRLPYYYCAWGRAGSKYSNGYLMGRVGAGTQSGPVLVCEAWSRAVKYRGEVVSYGPFRYYWDGEGKVYLSASPTAVQAVTVDDGPVVITAKGEINRVGKTWSGILEITPLLGIGANDIWVDVRDNPSYGVSIGAVTPLYIMRSL